MKKIDRAIVAILAIFIIFSVAYGLVFNFYLTLKLFAIIIASCYFFFICMHMAILFPAGFIIMYIEDFVRVNNAMQHLRNKSEILYYTIFVLIIALVFSIVYIGVPFLAAMLFNGSIDLNHAIELLKLIK